MAPFLNITLALPFSISTAVVYCGGGRSLRGISVTVLPTPARSSVTVNGALPVEYGNKSPNPKPAAT
jgi:hypothetical protein